MEGASRIEYSRGEEERGTGKAKKDLKIEERELGEEVGLGNEDEEQDFREDRSKRLTA